MSTRRVKAIAAGPSSGGPSDGLLDALVTGEPSAVASELLAATFEFPTEALAYLLAERDAAARRAAIGECVRECNAFLERHKNAEGLKLWPVRECVARVHALAAPFKSAAMPAHYVEHPNQAEALPRNRRALADMGRNPDGSPKAGPTKGPAK